MYLNHTFFLSEKLHVPTVISTFSFMPSQARIQSIFWPDYICSLTAQKYFIIKSNIILPWNKDAEGHPILRLKRIDEVEGKSYYHLDNSIRLYDLEYIRTGITPSNILFGSFFI